MQIAMNNDYVRQDGDPLPELQGLAAAGFTRTQWIHHWGDDFIYHDSEIDQIARWLDELNLTMDDLHASSGREKQWTSPKPWAQQAGIELVRNRIRMTRRLEGHTIVMHLQRDSETDVLDACAERFARTFDALLGDLERYDIRIALENLFSLGGNKPLLDRVLGMIDSPRLGICYDLGHGHMIGDGFEFVRRYGDRLFSLHVHENDGVKDQHALPFTGKLDWEQATKLIAQSSYNGPLTLEVGKRPGNWEGDETSFLAAAFERATKVASMVDAHRTAL